MAETETKHWLFTEGPEDWVQSDTDGVYFRSEADSKGLSGYSPNAAVRNGEQLREAFGDDLTVVITAGPYRMYDVKYRLDPEEKKIHLDYYSVRAGHDRIGEIIEDLENEGVFA